MHEKIAVMGYSSMYNNNATFAQKAKMILNLALVPVPYIDTYNDAVSVDVSEELTTLLNWFKDACIGEQNRRENSGRLTLFPHEM